MGAAVSFDGPNVSVNDRKVAEDAKAYLGESIGLPMICAYDPVYALKAGIEKAQSLDPKEIAAVLPTVTFRTLLGGMAHFGGNTTYGSAGDDADLHYPDRER